MNGIRSYLFKLIAGLCIGLSLAGGLHAQTLGVTISGRPGPYLGGTGRDNERNIHLRRHDYRTQNDTCLVSFISADGPGSGATGSVTLTGTNTINEGTATTIVTPGSGYEPRHSRQPCPAGTATCSGTANITSIVDDPSGLNGE